MSFRRYQESELDRLASKPSTSSNSSNMSTSTRTSDYGSLTDNASSRGISSAFSRLKYTDLNPMTSSYYKPLMRTFGKRFDSPKVCWAIFILGVRRAIQFSDKDIETINDSLRIFNSTFNLLLNSPLWLFKFRFSKPKICLFSTPPVSKNLPIIFQPKCQLIL